MKLKKIKKNDDDKVIEELMNEVQRTGNQEITFSQFKESMLNYAKQDIFNLSIKADDDGNNNDNSIIDGDSKN